MNPEPDQTLTPEELARYEWQMWHEGMGEAGQLKLKQATVLISRVGGLGGLVAYDFASKNPKNKRTA